MQTIDNTLFWTAFGALGSSAGALIGAIALIIAIKAYRLPMRKQLNAHMHLGSLINEKMSMEVYSITIRWNV